MVEHPNRYQPGSVLSAVDSPFSRVGQENLDLNVVDRVMNQQCSTPFESVIFTPGLSSFSVEPSTSSLNSVRVALRESVRYLFQNSF